MQGVGWLVCFTDVCASTKGAARVQEKPGGQLGSYWHCHFMWFKVAEALSLVVLETVLGVASISGHEEAYRCLLKPLVSMDLEEDLATNVRIYGTVSCCSGNCEFLSLLIFLSIWRAIANVWMRIIVKRLWQTLTSSACRVLEPVSPHPGSWGSAGRRRGCHASDTAVPGEAAEAGSVLTVFLIHVTQIFKNCGEHCNNHCAFTQSLNSSTITLWEGNYFFYRIPKGLNTPYVRPTANHY